MDLKLLDTLKDRLVTGKEFFKVYEYFLDHFGENDEFMRLGQRVRHPLLETVCPQILRQLLKCEIDPSRFLLTGLPEQQFIHGSGLFQGNVANVIYFEDVETGLLAVAAPFQSSETKFIRFSPKTLRGSIEPSRN